MVNGMATPVLSIRVPQAEQDAWREAAGDKPVGEWVRETCNAAILGGTGPDRVLSACEHPRGHRRRGASGLMICTVCNQPVG